MNALKSHVFERGDLFESLFLNLVHPQSAELRFRQLVLELDDHIGCHFAPVVLFLLSLHLNVDGGSGKNRIGYVVGGDCAVGFPVVELFFRVEVLVRPFLKSEEFLLVREILAGNENRLACCRWVYDGVGDLLVERINAVLF